MYEPYEMHANIEKYYFCRSNLNCNYVVASEDKKLRLTSENYFATNQTCQSYEVIEGKKYCVKESLIPLNSCGEQSDWPCMDPEGCLGITQFIKE